MSKRYSGKSFKDYSASKKPKLSLKAMSLPFLTKKPVDLPPIVSVELIQITDKTNIPFAPKAKKIIEKKKKKKLKEKYFYYQVMVLDLR